MDRGAAAFPLRLVFAGQGGQQHPEHDPAISPSANAAPAVNNNATTNFITGPDGGNYNRGVTNQDAGGADIVISYTPERRRPHQRIGPGVHRGVNGGAFSSGKLYSSASPYQ
jgi:hypothetical protein